MRSLSILIAALASLSAVHAGFIFPRQLPSCAQKCFALNAIPTNGCNVADNTCLCKDFAFSQNSINCITNACTSQADVDATVKLATQICQAAGVNTPPAGVTTAVAGQPKTFTTIPVPSSTAATTAKSGAAMAPIGVNQPLILFGAVAVAFGVAL